MSPHDPGEAAHAMAGGLLGLVCLARELVLTRRPVDLAGLDDKVGLLCARVLDLPPAHGRSLVPSLAALAEAIDRLRQALEAPA